MGGCQVEFIKEGLAPGNQDFSFQIAAPGTSTSTLKATSASPISIAVLEL